MAHGSLKEFDSSKELIKDFHERFDLYCLTSNIRSENADAVHQKKAMFITLLGKQHLQSKNFWCTRHLFQT